jgi:DNA polymerase-3 subunit gamma/tau
MLTNHAFNAMLKTLEEPPAHVKFILATTDPQKIPVTVLSRCLQFNLKQMPAGHIVSHLERILGEEKIPFEAQALRLLARSADGSMRDALSLTDQAIAYSANQVTEEAVRGMLGALDQSYLIRLLDALAAGDGAGVLAVADEMALRSLSFSTALQDLASLLHRVGWAQFAPSSVLEEWPEAADLRRFADMLSPEQVQLFYQIATIGRSELGLAPDEYAGFTMTLLRMLAFEPAPNGGGGGGAVPAARSGTAGSAEGRRTAVPAVAARQGAAAEPVATAAAPARAAEPARSAVTTQAGNANQTSSAQTTSASPVPHAAGHGQAGSREGGAGAAASEASTATAIEGDTQTDISGSKAPAGAGTPPGGAAVAEANAGAEAAEGADAATSSPMRPAQEDATLPAARDDSRQVPSSAHTANGPSASTQAVAPAAKEDTSVAARQMPPPAAAEAVPRRAGGASAALDVLRSAGLKVSSDRGRSAAPVAPAAPAPKPAAPRVNVPIPTPGAPLDRQGAAPASARPQRNSAPNAAQGASSVPPWEDMPPDDYMPASADDAYFGPPDDGYVPVFDSGPDDVRLTPAAPTPAPVVDTTPLPPGVPLDAIGFDGDWPALAVGLALKGISYQLAFNSELISLDGGTLRLNVPVPQYADPAQVAKLKAALAERLGKPIDVQVEVGPARRTAAALDAIACAQRQQDAEREIRQDPFVQSLIRDFGASIVPDSIRPIAPEGGQGAAGGAAAAH